MSPELNIAKKAALKAAHSIEQLRQKHALLSVPKKIQNDYLQQVIQVTLNDLFFSIKRAYPEDEIQTEEQTLTEHRNPERVWLINPMDGLTNFLYGFDHCALSMILLEHNQCKEALVYNPITDDLYTATKGKGAFLNQHRLRISPDIETSQSLVATNPPENGSHPGAHHLAMRTISKHVADLRVLGCPSLDLASVASGKLNGYWQNGMAKAGLLAGMLLVEEAGGQCLDFQAKRESAKHNQVVAGHLKFTVWLASQLKSLHA